MDDNVAGKVRPLEDWHYQASIEIVGDEVVLQLLVFGMQSNSHVSYIGGDHVLEIVHASIITHAVFFKYEVL